MLRRRELDEATTVMDNGAGNLSPQNEAFIDPQTVTVSVLCVVIDTKWMI
jgi:hypothetical protein